MERLTHRETPENTAYVDRCMVSLNWYSMTDEGFRGPAIDLLAAYEDTGFTPERVAELAQAEKARRLVVLPCKVGDAVFVRTDDEALHVTRVQGISISATGKDTILRFGGYPAASVWGRDIGKTWFRSRREAEEALKLERREEAHEMPGVRIR